MPPPGVFVGTPIDGGAAEAYRREAEQEAREAEARERDKRRRTREVTEALHRLARGEAGYSDCRMIAVVMLEGADR